MEPENPRLRPATPHEQRGYLLEAQTGYSEGNAHYKAVAAVEAEREVQAREAGMDIPPEHDAMGELITQVAEDLWREMSEAERRELFTDGVHAAYQHARAQRVV